MLSKYVIGAILLVNFNPNRKIARFKGNLIKQAQQLYSLAIVRWKDKVEEFKVVAIFYSFEV
jgi:hypothetical protein